MKLRALREYERSHAWRDEGYLSAAAAVREKCNANHGAVHAALELARRLEELPGVAGAFAAGDISRYHAAVIASACTAERLRAFQAVESQLAGVAQQMKPGELGGYVKRLADAIDGDGGAADDAAMHERRSFHLAKTFDGMRAGEITSDPESGEILETALAAEMERDRLPKDGRTRSQRRHDALVNLCRRALDNAELGTARNARPHVSIVADITALADVSAEHVADARIEAAHTGHLSQATLERLLCDCAISRVVTDGKSAVLDIGRASRTVPPAMWRALVARDRHCQGPNCDRPPGWCEAHHVQWWTRGGSTCLDNLVLLCHHHHRERHTHAP